MKKLVLFIAVVAFCHGLALAQSCLPEGITFTTQAQIDSFQVNYPGCTEIEGYVDIGDWLGTNYINNLDSLIVINSIGGSLSIHLTYLLNLNGLDNLTSIAGNLEIQSNGFLTSLMGLDNLSFLGGGLGILLCPLTSLIELSNLTSIGGSLAIAACDDLTNLNGLDNVTSIDGGILILHDDGLVSLSGLDNLISINSEISIISNITITSLAGLDYVNANTIDSLLIRDNPYLSTCDVQSICDYLAAPGGTIEIHDNASGCNSSEEVEEACEALVIEDYNPSFNIQHSTFNIQISPNPLTSQTTLEFTLQQGGPVHLAIYNQMGEWVAVPVDEYKPAGVHKISWNATGLPAGVYYFRLHAATTVLSGKMILAK